MLASSRPRIGSRYRMRDGRVVGPLRHTEDPVFSADFPFCADPLAGQDEWMWHADGRALLAGISPFDLVEEVDAPERPVPCVDQAGLDHYRRGVRKVMGW